MQWKGVFPAIITPFTPEGELDLDIFSKNLFAQMHAGIEGVILGGTLGESSVLGLDEKEELVLQALQITGERIPVVLAIAEGSTREAVRQARWAETLGLKGLMLLPPMRYRSDYRETVTFFKEVAGSVELPIMIYNNPVDYKTLVTLDMLDELQRCVNIRAIKDSTRDVSNVTRMVTRFGKRFKILCGVDTLAMESLAMGADGWVGGLVNAFPRETVALYRLAKSGRMAEALEIHRWFLPLLELDLHPKLVQYIKLAAEATGMGTVEVRAPRLTLEGAEKEEISDIIRTALLTRPELGEYLSINI